MVIGVDVGGTNLRAGRFDQDRMLERKSVLLKDKDVLQKTLDQLIALIESVLDSSVTGIGIGVPSVVDVETGIVTDANNISSWKRVELKRILEDQFRMSVWVNNDVNCFIVGEHRYGIVRDYKSVVGLAMGTGLGGGIIINNQLYAGSNCGAGEFGMVPYLDANIEAYCSDGFFKKNYNTSALDASLKAVAGDQAAINSWNEFGRHMGNAIKTVIYTYDPEAIVLGGSLVKSYPLFVDSMNESLQDLGFCETLKKLKIFTSQNSNIALLGAASLVP